MAKSLVQWLSSSRSPTSNAELTSSWDLFRSMTNAILAPLWSIYVTNLLDDFNPEKFGLHQMLILYGQRIGIDDRGFSES